MKKFILTVMFLLGCSVSSYAAPVAGYFFQACDDPSSAMKNTPPYMLEIANDTSKVIKQGPLCAYKLEMKQPEKNWTVALVPFHTLSYFDNLQSPYQVIAQISDSSTGNNDGYSSYLIVKKDSNFYSLADLADSTILASTKVSFSTSIYPQYVLGSFFEDNNITLLHSPSHKKELADFEANEASAAFVNNYIVSPSELKKYRVIMTFHWLPDYLVLVNKSVVSESQASQIKHQLLNQTGRGSFSYHEPNDNLIKSYQSIISSQTTKAD